MTDPMTLFSAAWLAAFQRRLNADPEMRVIGDWFTVSFALSADDARCVLRFDQGRLIEFTVSPRLDVRCEFG